MSDIFFLSRCKYLQKFFYDNRFITDFKEKAQLFNSFFSKQCSLISNNSSLPNHINYTTEKRLSAVALSVEAIGKVFKILILIKHMVMIA